MNVAASRITTGNHPVYAELESALTHYFGCETALLAATGYQTNLIASQGVAGDVDRVMLDRRTHPSLRDAARMVGAPIVPFDHRDPEALRAEIRKHRKTGERLALFTDGTFSHDGRVAPLKAYREILEPTDWILVDDAHGVGTLGESGGGAVELESVSRERLIQTGTFSKAFGVFGGMILAGKEFRERVIERSGMFRGSTPPPPFLCAAALESLDLLSGQSGEALRRRLDRRADRLRSRLGLTEFPPGPIFSITPESPAAAAAIERALLAHGILPPLIRYPGGPESGFFRFAVSSAHSMPELDSLAAAMATGIDAP